MQGGKVGLTCVQKKIPQVMDKTTKKGNKMKQYISIDDNCEKYFSVLLNTIYKDEQDLPIHTFETVAVINRKEINE